MYKKGIISPRAHQKFIEENSKCLFVLWDFSFKRNLKIRVGISVKIIIKFILRRIHAGLWSLRGLNLDLYRNLKISFKIKF
jgi:hypothetical protein